MHLTGSKPSEIFKVIRMLTYSELPKNRRDPMYKYAEWDLTGSSFIVHPDLLLYNAYKHSAKDIAIYIALAAFRPLADYLMHGKTTLELDLAPADPREILDDPSLLPVDSDGNIHFIYEEANNQTIH